MGLCSYYPRFVNGFASIAQTLHPIAFASHAVNGAEKNYCITDLETLTVVWAIMHFKTNR